MTEQELIEQLAEKEHASWARWQGYLHSRCDILGDGSLVIPAELVARWQRQIDTPYADLSEREKQSDREEVTYILPIIYAATGWVVERGKPRPFRDDTDQGARMMATVKTYALEATGETRPVPCHCGDPEHTRARAIYRDSRTSALVTLDEAEPGAVYRSSTWQPAARSQDAGEPIVVVLPNGFHWSPDSRASNCTMPGDDEHHCWVRHGDQLDALTVDKNGATCGAGAGSILAGGYHGFLRGGCLEEC